MDGFVVIGERDGSAFIEGVIMPIEQIVLRYDISLIDPVQAYSGVDLSRIWQRFTPRFYWINRFNVRCGCLLDESCSEPHQCYQKMWI